MKKLMLLLCVCICLCGCSYKIKYKGRYNNVSYGVNELGHIEVKYVETKYDPIKDTYTILVEKNWYIDGNNLTCFYLTKIEPNINNVFYDFGDFYRLVVYR